MFLSVCRNAHMTESITSFSCWCVKNNVKNTNKIPTSMICQDSHRWQHDAGTNYNNVLRQTSGDNKIKARKQCAAMARNNEKNLSRCSG